MLEETGRQRVKEIAYHYLGDKSEELATSAELETYRKTYIVTKPFEYQRFDKSQYEIRIVIDEVSAPAEAHKADKFYHQVGEVELTKDVVGGETDDEHKAIREEEVKSMKAHMDEFLFWNSGVFPTEPAPKGKLQAFREWKEGKGGPVVESMSSV